MFPLKSQMLHGRVRAICGNVLTLIDKSVLLLNGSTKLSLSAGTFAASGDMTVQSPNATDFTITPSGVFSASGSVSIGTPVVNHGKVKVGSGATLYLPSGFVQDLESGESEVDGRMPSIELSSGTITAESDIVINGGKKSILQGLHAHAYGFYSLL